MAKPWFEDWEEAANACKQRKAVSRDFDYVGYSKERKTSAVYRVEIIKPLQGDPYMVYAKTGIKVHGVKVTAAMCDKVRQWKSY